MNIVGLSKLCRGLIVAGAVCGILLLGLGFSEPAEVEALRELWQEASGQTQEVSVLIFQLVVAVIGLGILIASLIGLYRFEAWGRKLFVAAVICGFMVTLFFGDTFYVSSLESVVETVLCMIDGALLVLVYLTPLATRFEKQKDSAGV